MNVSDHAVNVTFPDKGAASYRSIISLVDGRLDLYRNPSPKEYLPLLDLQELGDDVTPLDLTTMASKIAYENPAYIREAVDNHLKVVFIPPSLPGPVFDAACELQAARRRSLS